MTCRLPDRLLLVGLAMLTRTVDAADPERFVLEPGDHVVVVGNTFAERVAQSGYFEAIVQAAHPDHEIVLRQVPWSADEVALRPREHSVPTMEDHLASFEADVIVMCFGMSESFAGLEGLAGFETALAAQIDAFRAETYNGEAPPRLVLVSPIAHEDLGAPYLHGPALAERNRVLAAYTTAMRDVADSKAVRFVDLLGRSAGAYLQSRPKLTSNGIHPNELGCFRFVGEIGSQLGWLDGSWVADDAVDDPGAVERLRGLAYDKHYHVRLLYRATNSEYVWGRRHKPYGIVNFPPEMEQLERMIHAREQAMWSMTLPSPAAIFAAAPTGPAIWERVPTSHDFAEDTWDPPQIEAKGTESSLGDLTVLPADEFAKSFTLPDGYVIECFASEQDFELLQCPLAMNFDAQGRLWVLCAPTYPHLMPGEAPRCRLIILEDTDGDGRADESTVWAERLYIPTGFAIDTDAVYLGQAPDLWKLSDTDGDGRADRREIVASGFGMPDSHHTISAFEWAPNGGFLLHEGVFTKTNVETPYGTRRVRDAAVWHYDTRNGRLEVLSHSGFANPWGHAFDDYGQSVLADASGGNNYAFSQVINAYEYPNKPKSAAPILNRGRPTAGCELVSSRHFPEDVQDSFLVNQSIGFHGTRWDQLTPEGSSWSAESMPEDLLTCSDVNFRPVGMEIGPDGALYIVDWSNPIVGHMQYSVRDPRRDHTHGRIWRIRHASRPLVTPPAIAITVPELLEQLRLPERNTRQHARRRLQRAAASDVFPALVSWTAALDSNDPEHDRLLLETLWLHQAFGRIDLDVLERVATLDEARARAGAIRVLRHWLQAGVVTPDEALPFLERAVTDEDMRVRLEAVVACGFVPSVSGASVAALAADMPMDDGLRIAMEEAIAFLARYGEPKSEIVRRLRLERTPADELTAMPFDDLVASVCLVRDDVPVERRVEALAFLETDDAARVRRMIDAVLDARYAEAATAALAPLLLDVPAPALDAAQADLLEAAESDDPVVRALVVAALVKSGDEHADRLHDDAALGTDVLAHLEPGDVPDRTLLVMRQAIETDGVEPMSAIEQVARHSGEDPATVAWMAGLITAVEADRLHQFGVAHGVAMAALRQMNRMPSSQWPEGYDHLRVDPATPEQMALGRAVFVDEIHGCARCHGVDGRGEEGFPPLDRSPWVLGNPERAAAIVVHGLYGEIELPDGRSFQSVMDPLGAGLDDEQIAAVLTYVRQSWGNYASRVTAAAVARGRAIKDADGAPLDVDQLAGLYPLSQDFIVPVSLQTVVADTPTRGLTTTTVVLAIVLPLGAVLVLFLIITRLDPASGSPN